MSLFTFIDTKAFSRIVADYLSDDEYGAMQMRLAANPDLGSVVPGTGGVRKMRWSQPGRGRRGGIRVIYYVKRADRVIWMLTLYAKNEAESIAPHILRAIKEEVDG